MTNNLNIIVRNANQSDSFHLWMWRNDVLTRNMSMNSSEISWEEHEKWFSKTIKRRNCKIYLATLSESTRVGMCRFDINYQLQEAEVSINLNPNFRNKNLSTLLLKKSIYIFLNRFKITLSARILHSNVASAKSFINNNFIIYSKDEFYNYFKRQI